MHFDLTSDQRAVREAMDEVCTTRWSGAAVRRVVAGDDAGDSLWRELVGSGWVGAGVNAYHGGSGLGTIELALICEVMGRALAPGALFGHISASILIQAGAGAALASRWLPELASGRARGAIAMLEADGSALAYDAEASDVVVVISPGGAAIAATTDCTMVPLEGLDLTRRLSRVTVGHPTVLDGDISAAVDRLEVALSAELVGVAERSMELAVAHAKTRQQFGRVVGAYQAVSHRCADMLLDVESARSAVLFAAWASDNDAEVLPFAASVAKVAAAQGAWRVTTSSIQVHGGIGFTWEHDCHLLLRRAATTASLLGSIDHHLDRVAKLRGVDNPAGQRETAEVSTEVSMGEVPLTP